MTQFAENVAATVFVMATLFAIAAATFAAGLWLTRRLSATDKKTQPRKETER